MNRSVDYNAKTGIADEPIDPIEKDTLGTKTYVKALARFIDNPRTLSCPPITEPVCYNFIWCVTSTPLGQIEGGI